ncbi:PQ-loop repeat-containing protein [Maribacter antarcticus]|uniref:hypothetical protein n=1 Tax=Maribacter antarcticus TaxID=505250 RepID=UPI000A81ACCF|nr:hypothetical protein [Maribacter antarcticus]
MERKIKEGYFLDDVTCSVVRRITFVDIQRFLESLPIILANTITVVLLLFITLLKMKQK